jgi:predicted permease
MDRLKGLIKQLRAAVRSKAAERDMRDELAFHLEREAEANRRRGMRPDEARRAASLAFGAAEGVKEEMRGAGLRGVVAEAARDMRHAIRGIRRRPSLAVAVIATLGLGIGVSTAMYSVVHAVIIRPLPYPGADRLVVVWETYPHWREQPVLSEMWNQVPLAWPDYQAWRRHQTSFEDVAVVGGNRMTLSGGGAPEVVRVGRPSGSFWRMVGFGPVEGRVFGEGEEAGGAPDVAVISHRVWQDRFGGDPGAVGQVLHLNGRPFEVVGILAPGLDFGVASYEVWIPPGAAGSELGDGNHNFVAIGRLRPGVTIAAATAEADGLLRGQQPPERRGARLVPYLDQFVGSARQPLLLLLAGTFVLLLIACVNVAALLAGDAARRDHEIATRRALGASRLRVIRQFVAESLALSLLAVVVGLGVVALSIPTLVSLAPANLPRTDDVGINGGVLGFALLAALLTSLVSSAAAVIAVERRKASLDTVPAARVTGGGRRLQPLFVGIQLALLTVLVTTAVLFGRSLLGVLAVESGMSIANRLTAVIQVPSDRFSTRSELVGFFYRLVAKVEAIPGVTRVSAVDRGPFAGTSSTSVEIEGLPPDAPRPQMQRRTVLDGYFDLLGIRIVRGTADLFGEAPAMVVNETAAAQLWPGRPTIGQRIGLRNRWYTVTGVAADVRDVVADRAPQATYYVSLEAGRDVDPAMRLLVETVGGPVVVADAMRKALLEVDPAIPMGEIATLETMLARTQAAERYRTLLVNVFAAASLVLAAVGIFGVTLRMMLRRRRELGVRLALGARPARIACSALGATAAGAAMGLAVGLAVAALVAPLLSQYLRDVPARDPATYAASAGLLLVVSLGAAAIPVVGAARMNLVAVLRED